MPVNASVKPDGRCPRFQRPVFEPFTPKPFEQQIAEERITAPGPKTRQFANMTPIADARQLRRKRTGRRMALARS